MADSAISNLTAGVQPTDADYFVTVQGGATVKVTAKQLANYAAVAQFSGSGTRYPGDFSNATLALRTLFLSSTVNGITDVGAIPNGAATTSRWTAYNASTPTNANFLSLEATSTLLTLKAGVAGAGTMLPFTMSMNGTEMYRVGPVSLNMMFGSTTDDGIHKYQFTGSYSIVGAYQLTGNSVILGSESVSGDMSAVTYNGSALSGDRNRFVNSKLWIDQMNEGAAQTIVAGAALSYTVDRWYAYCTGANVTGQQIAVTGGYRYRFTGLAGNTLAGFGQRIAAADIADRQGKTMLLRLTAFSTSITTLTWTAYTANSVDTFGTLAAPTRAQFATGTLTINTVESTYFASIPLNANAVNGVEIVFTCGALLATQTLTLGELGFITSTVNETELPFRFKAIDLMLCQRRLRKSFAQGTAPVTNLGAGTGELTWRPSTAGATAVSPASLLLQPPMAGPPTGIFYNPAAANAFARDLTGNLDTTATSILFATDGCVFLTVTGNAGSAANVRMGLHYVLKSEL